MSVDTANHVITDIGAYHADSKDNKDLPDIVARLKKTVKPPRAILVKRIGRHGLQQRRELCPTGKRKLNELYTATRNL